MRQWKINEITEGKNQENAKRPRRERLNEIRIKCPKLYWNTENNTKTET
jgi:hypothetical protein